MRGVRETALVLLAISSLLYPAGANALDSTPSDGHVSSIDSSLLLTQYGASNDRLDYIEVYNDSDQLFILDGWTAEYSVELDGIVTTVPLNIVLSGLLEPGTYTALADTSSGLLTPFTYTITGTNLGRVQSARLIPPASANYMAETVENPTYSKSNQCNGVSPPDSTPPEIFGIKRNTSTSTGTYLSSMCYVDLLNDTRTIFIDALYIMPVEPLLEIVEIVPHARSCSPFEEALNCSDYVKLYNGGTESVQLEKYRLRSGTKGQSASSSNTFVFAGAIASGEYKTYDVDVSNSGSWLWFEDSYGLEKYEATATQYPSAGTTKVGQAWMYDQTDGTWKWTTQLSGSNNAPKYLAPVITAPSKPSLLQTCRTDQYRNPQTNRCKLKIAATSTSSLVPCRSDQTRNPATNRCKSTGTLANTTSLVACKVGQFRNPETNRCKSSSIASSTLKPCRADQERNVETNRCRNVLGASIPSAAFAVEDTAHGGSADPLGWIAFAGVGSLAIGYGVWEWRREVGAGVSKLAGVFKK